MMPRNIPRPVVVVVVIYAFLIGAVVGAAILDNFDGTPWVGTQPLSVVQWGDADFTYQDRTGAP